MFFSSTYQSGVEYNLMPRGGRVDGSNGGLVDRLLGLNVVTVCPALVLFEYTPVITPKGGRSGCSTCGFIIPEEEIFSFFIGARGIPANDSCGLFPSI